MNTDENFRVKLIYEKDPPHSDAVHSQSSYSDGRHGLENGAVRGRLFPLGGDEGSAGTTDLPRLEFNFQQVMIHSESDYEQSHHERLDALVEIVRDLYEASDPKPAFVYGLQHAADEALMWADEPPIDGEALSEDQINHAPWLSVFPPRLVETYGRETLLSAPVWRAEEWEDGAILLVQDDEPLLLNPVGEMNEHLGLEDPGL